MITRDEARALGASKFWEGMTDQERATFQLYEERPCMPFPIFHEAVEVTLGRPVFTHEFANPDNLKAELRGDKQPPTMQEILELIPADKRLVLAFDHEGV